MKRKLLNLILGLFIVGVSAQQSQAATIIGKIGIAGTATLDTADVNTATQVTGWPAAFVLTRSGDFPAGLLGGSPVMSASWTFGASQPALWAIGGFTFDLLNSTIDIQGGDDLSVSGTGVVSGNGFDPTWMTWNFTSQNPGDNSNPPQFTFSASGQAFGQRVPEGGAALSMLGMGLVGVVAMRKKLARKA